MVVYRVVGGKDHEEPKTVFWASIHQTVLLLCVLVSVFALNKWPEHENMGCCTHDPGWYFAGLDG